MRVIRLAVRLILVATPVLGGSCTTQVATGAEDAPPTAATSFAPTITGRADESVGTVVSDETRTTTKPSPASPRVETGSGLSRSLVTVITHALTVATTSALLASARPVHDPAADELLTPAMVPTAGPNATYTYGLDGSTQSLDVYWPSDWKPTDARPVIVFIHGGAWSWGDRTNLEFVPAIKAQLRRGFVVVSIDYRLAGWVEDATAPGGHRAVNPFPTQMYDVDWAIRWVRASATALGINPNELIAAGHSAGALMALLAGVAPGTWVDPDLPLTFQGVSPRPQGVVSIASPTDLMEVTMPTIYGVSGNYALNAVFGCPFADPAADTPLTCADVGVRQAAMSPTTYATRDDPPVYLAQGDMDPLLLPSDASKPTTYMALVMYRSLVAARGHTCNDLIDVVDGFTLSGTVTPLPGRPPLTRRGR